MNEQNRQFTLLLVDDNPINLTLLAKIIELDLPQVRVLTASNGMQGLQLAGEQQIDGAFIDVQMPEMSGLEMCRRLKADPRTAAMPLVLITAHLASPEMRAEGLEVGAYDFISQPISNVEMLARIKVMLRLCEGERSRQSNPAQPQSSEAHSDQLRWLSGLLISGDGQLADSNQPLLQDLAAELAEADELDEQLLIDQLVNRFPRTWRKTFLRLALLDTMPISLAGKLSEIKDIEAVFDYLRRQNLLLQPAVSGEDVFCFKADVHGQLKTCLEQRLETEDQQQVYQLAADWYQQKSDPLAAFSCLLRAEQYPAISQLFSFVGLELFAGQDLPELLQLLERIPEEEAVRCGWLALCTGTSFMLTQPLEVDSWLELARSRFVASGDRRGELLAVTQQIIQYLVVDGQLELGGARLQRLRELAENQLEFLKPYNRLKVQFARAMGELAYRGDLKSCEELLATSLSEALREKLVGLQMNFTLLQSLLGVFQGRFRVARSAMEQAKVTANCLPEYSFPVLASNMVECELLYAIGEHAAFARRRHIMPKLFGGQEFLQTAFSPQLNFFTALCDLANGKNSAAEELLDVTLVESPAASRPHLQSWLLQLRGLLHAQAGRVDAARSDCAKGLELREQVAIDIHRLPNLLLAGATSLQLQDYQQGAEQLKSGLTISVKLGEERYRGGFHAWLAALYIGCGETALALEQLELLFELLHRQRIDFFFALTPELIRKLAPLAATVSEWSEPLQRLVRRWLDCGITEQGRLVPLAHLQDLGCFKYWLNGQCCDLSEVGQSSRQLLALLAVAPNYSMSSELLMGTLWPESPPSKARNSFDTALSRLRKALEGHFGKQVRQDYLVLEKGMLLLRNLRVDCKEYQKILEQSRLQLQRQNLWQAELTFWQAEQLWQGEFLAGFELDADLPYCRDECCQLRLEQLIGLASLLRQRGENGDAIRLLQSGLFTEPTHDLLVQQLLDIYQQQGETRAARQLLENYRKALQNEDYDEEEIDELIMTLGPQRLEI